MVLSHLEIHMKEDEVGPLPNTIYKNILKMINGLNLRAKVIKSLEENVVLHLHDLGLSNGLLDMILKAQLRKGKNNWTYQN